MADTPQKKERDRIARMSGEGRFQFVASGSRLYGSRDFLPWKDLAPGSAGWERIDRMRNDEQVKAALAVKKFAVIAPGYQFEPADSDSPAAMKAAEWWEDVVARVPGAFNRVLYRILGAMDYGFSITEVVKTLEDKVVPKKLKSIRPHDLTFIVDPYGNLLELVQKVDGSLSSFGDPGVYIQDGGRLRDFRTRQTVSGDPRSGGIRVPAQDVIHYTHGESWGDPRGESDLISGYRSFWQKDNVLKFWAMYLERFGAPTVVGYHDGLDSPEMRAQFENIVENLRSFTGVTMPEGRARVELLEAMGKAGGEGFERFLDFCDRGIAKAVLMPALLGFGSEAETGSLARSQTHFDVFLWVAGHIQAILVETVQEQFVNPISELNFPEDLTPRFKMNPLSEDDKQAIAELWIKGIQGSVTESQVEDEEHFRQLLGFPALPEGYAEEKAAEKEEGEGPEGPEDQEDDRGLPLNIRGVSEAPGGAPGGDQDQGKGRVQAAASSAYRASESQLARIDREERDRVAKWSNTLKDHIMKVLPTLERWVEEKSPQDFGLDGKKLKINAGWLRDTKNLMKDMMREGMTAGIRDVLMETGIPTAMLEREVENALKFAVVPGFEQMPFEAAEAYIEEKAFWVTGVLAEDLTEQARRTISEKMSQGYTTPVARDRLYELLAPHVGGAVIDPVSKRRQVITPWRLETIVRTNSNDGYNRGRLAQLKDPALKGSIAGYEFMAVLDERTTDICAYMDGKRIHVNDGQVLAYTPPLHFNCRSILSPIMIGERGAYENYLTPKEKKVADALIPQGFGKTPPKVPKTTIGKAAIKPKPTPPKPPPPPPPPPPAPTPKPKPLKKTAAQKAAEKKKAAAATGPLDTFKLSPNKKLLNEWADDLMTQAPPKMQASIRATRPVKRHKAIKPLDPKGAYFKHDWGDGGLLALRGEIKEGKFIPLKAGRNAHSLRHEYGHFAEYSNRLTVNEAGDKIILRESWLKVREAMHETRLELLMDWKDKGRPIHHMMEYNRKYFGLQYQRDAKMVYIDELKAKLKLDLPEAEAAWFQKQLDKRLEELAQIDDQLNAVKNLAAGDILEATAQAPYHGFGYLDDYFGAITHEIIGQGHGMGYYIDREQFYGFGSFGLEPQKYVDSAGVTLRMPIKRDPQGNVVPLPPGVDGDPIPTFGAGHVTQAFANLYDTYADADQARWLAIEKYTPRVAKAFEEYLEDVAASPSDWDLILELANYK